LQDSNGFKGLKDWLNVLKQKLRLGLISWSVLEPKKLSGKSI
jgi:hypothetical protein